MVWESLERRETLHSTCKSILPTTNILDVDAQYQAQTKCSAQKQKKVEKSITTMG